jgi:hypothetical protein
MENTLKKKKKLREMMETLQRNLDDIDQNLRPSGKYLQEKRKILVIQRERLMKIEKRL